MAYTHVAHDCVVGSHTTMANNTTLGGHVEIGDIRAPGVRLALAAHGDIRDSVGDLSSLAVGSGGSVSLASATGSIDVRSISGDPLHTAVRVNIPNASGRSARVEWTDNGNTSRIGYAGSGLLSIEAPTSGSAISFVNGPLSVASPSTAAWRSAIFGDHDLQVGMVNAPLSAVTLATSGTIRQPNPGDPALAGIEQRLAAQPTIAAPTINLHGGHDGVGPAPQSDGNVKFFTGVYERRLIPRVGHNVPQEAPSATIAALRDLMKGTTQ